MPWRFIIPGLWLAWLIYWLVGAMGNKATAQRESVRRHLIHRLPVLIGVLLLVVPHRPGHWLSHRFLPHALDFELLGVAMVVLEFGFTVWARVHLGSNWSGTVTLKKEHELVRSGPYHWVRHPIYTGVLLAILGSVIALGQWRGLLAFGFITLGLVLKLRVEERWMGEAFGNQYARYKREVAALIPGIY